jgi:hypothetical protein
VWCAKVKAGSRREALLSEEQMLVRVGRRASPYVRSV